MLFYIYNISLQSIIKSVEKHYYHKEKRYKLF